MGNRSKMVMKAAEGSRKIKQQLAKIDRSKTEVQSPKAGEVPVVVQARGKLTKEQDTENAKQKLKELGW